MCVARCLDDYYDVCRLMIRLCVFRYEYMIDNVILLLKRALNGRDVNELTGQLHPLGQFDESIMRSICTFESNAKGYSDLYETVLIDTPIGTYFSKFLEESAGGDRMDGTSDVRNVLEEMQMELIKNSMLKLWLEDFYNFCQKIGGDTAVIMGEILKARADRIAINITLNSFGTPLNEPAMRISDRKPLYPSIGSLYPDATALLAEAGDESALGSALDSIPVYRKIWEVHQSDGVGSKSIDDAFYERDVQMAELAFQSQTHFGTSGPESSCVSCLPYEGEPATAWSTRMVYSSCLRNSRPFRLLPARTGGLERARRSSTKPFGLHRPP
ncbi:unnamed protein product [Peronospora destructor]|uniref:Uncharacterized protein n=1 Tax=Peronospora destructor TaxID=86335 RepID=A0AAV0U459_9STRA|nr:unnamed protein product [Peronospora destructor]